MEPSLLPFTWWNPAYCLSHGGTQLTAFGGCNGVLVLSLTIKSRGNSRQVVFGWTGCALLYFLWEMWVHVCVCSFFRLQGIYCGCY